MKKPLVASRSKGKSGKYFGYYHCSRGHKYFGVNKTEFEKTVANYLEMLQAKPGFLPLFREVVRDVWIQKNRAAKLDADQTKAYIDTMRQRQASLVDRIPACKSLIVQDKLEQQIEELEECIKLSEKQLRSTGIKEDEIAAYFQLAKKLMEHPKPHVFSARTKEKLEKTGHFIFKSRPTFADLADGSPELTLIYRLNGDTGCNENLLAGQLSMQWNSFEQDVLAARW